MVLAMTACAFVGKKSAASSTQAVKVPNSEIREEIESSDETITGRLVVYSGCSEPLIQPVIEAFELAHPQVKEMVRAKLTRA